jgi:hypothetical protein
MLSESMFQDELNVKHEVEHTDGNGLEADGRVDAAPANDNAAGAGDDEQTDPDLARVWDALRQTPALAELWRNITRLVRAHLRFWIDADGEGWRLVERWVAEYRPKDDTEAELARTLREEWDSAKTRGIATLTLDELVRGLEMNAEFVARQMKERAQEREAWAKAEALTALEYGLDAMRSGKMTGTERAIVLEKMNREHAVIPIGSSVRYLHQTDGPEGQPVIRFLRKSDMEALYDAVVIDKQRNAFVSWSKWPGRLQYIGMDLFPPPLTAPPGYFNLWRGFAVEPKDGEWSLFRNHLRDKVCGGDQKL